MNTSKPKIDWLNHVLEFLVVIIGILLAFQLNKCSANRQQNANVDIHLSEIIKETESNKYFLEEAIAYTESNQLKFDTIFQLIESGENFSKVNFLSLDLLNLGGVYLRKNAYKTLVETGDVKFIKKFEQKQKIVNLYEFYKWVEMFDEISLKLHQTDYYPYLKENFDFARGTPQSDEVYKSKYFINILSAYDRTNQNRLIKYKECLEQIDKYLEATSLPE